MAADTNPSGTGPWRVLILDRSPEDPKWIIATITLSSDVRPAELDPAGRYADWAQVTGWAHERLGRPAAMVPVADSLAWRIDEGGQPR